MKLLYYLYSILDFGKHKGEHVIKVIESDPGWLEWALDNVQGFRLSKDAQYELDGCSVDPMLDDPDPIGWM